MIIFLIQSFVLNFFFKNPPFSIIILFLILLFLLPIIHQIIKYLKNRNIYYISINLNQLIIKKKTPHSHIKLIKLIEVSEIKSILYAIEEIDTVNNPDYIAFRLLNNKKVKIYKEKYYGGLKNLCFSIAKFLNIKCEIRIYFKKSIILRNFCFLSINFLILLASYYTGEFNIWVLSFLILITIFWILVNLTSIHDYLKNKKNRYNTL